MTKANMVQQRSKYDLFN